MSEFFLGTVGRGKVGRTQYVDNKTHTRGQDKHIRPPKIGGRVASLVATVAHVKSLMDMSNQWSLSVTGEAKNYEKLAVFTLFPAARPLNIFFSTKKKFCRVFICNRTPIHEGRHQNQKFFGNETP